MQVGQQFSSLPVELFKIDKPETARLTPQPDIFRHGQVRNGTQLLLNNGDTGVQGFDRLMKLTAFAFDIDFTGIRTDKTHQDAQERGFTGTIPAAQGVNGTSLQ